MGVRVSFLQAPAAATAKAPEGVRVPGAAIVQRDGRDVAFALGEKDEVELRTLALGATFGDDRQVLSGLSAGDTVVLDPPAGLQDHGRIVQAQE
jgi:hypothetical protein